MVLLGLGSYCEARAVLQKALQADPTHVPALFAAAQLALATAHYRIAQGAPGELLVCWHTAMLCQGHTAGAKAGGALHIVVLRMP